MEDAFWWSYIINNLLIKNLNIKSVIGLLAACFCVMLLAFVFESLRYLQAKQRQYEISLRSQQIRLICRSDSATLLTTTRAGPSNVDYTNPLNITLKHRVLFLFYKFSVWMTMTINGYIIMLLVMTYNGWLLISTIIGGGLGYFIFGHLFMKINLQNCQIIRDTFCKKNCETDSVPSGGDGETTPVLQPTTSTSRSSSATTSKHHSCHVEVSNYRTFSSV